MQCRRSWCFCLAVLVIVSVAGVEAKPVKMEGLEQCTVLDYNWESTRFQLPTNLTVKPLSHWWYLKLILSDEQKPAVCILFEEIDLIVNLSLFSGDCDNGTNLYLGYLSNRLKYQTWTNIGLKTTSNSVIIHEPQNGSIVVATKSFTLPPTGVQMMIKEMSDLEVAVGCTDNCPVYYHRSSEPNIKRQVGEWEESFKFHFKPGPSFSKLLYEVWCKGEVFSHEVEIKPWNEGDAREWHLIELELRQNNATLKVNKLLEIFQLLETCISYTHVIWIMGDGYFSFNCTPRDEEPTTQGTQLNDSMHPWIKAVISLVTILVKICILLIIISIIKKKMSTYSYTLQKKESGYSTKDTLESKTSKIYNPSDVRETESCHKSHSSPTLNKLEKSQSEEVTDNESQKQNDPLI